jgi:hypothetical protein
MVSYTWGCNSILPLFFIAWKYAPPFMKQIGSLPLLCYQHLTLLTQPTKDVRTLALLPLLLSNIYKFPLL